MKHPLTRSDFTVPSLLVLLSIVPALGGIARLSSVASGTTSLANNDRFLGAPTPVVLHIVCATLYCLLGAFQFSPGLRRRAPSWHRRAGALAVLCGIVAAATGLFMTTSYAIPPSLQGPLLYATRVVVAVAMLASLLLAVASIRARDIPRHEAFMVRAYALGQGAGTQVLVLLPWMLLSGEEGGLTRDLLMLLAWLLNLAVAEAVIRARVGRRALGFATA